MKSKGSADFSWFRSWPLEYRVPYYSPLGGVPVGIPIWVKGLPVRMSSVLCSSMTVPGDLPGNTCTREGVAIPLLSVSFSTCLVRITAVIYTTSDNLNSSSSQVFFSDCHKTLVLYDGIRTTLSSHLPCGEEHRTLFWTVLTSILWDLTTVMRSKYLHNDNASNVENYFKHLFFF